MSIAPKPTHCRGWALSALLLIATSTSGADLRSSLSADRGDVRLSESVRVTLTVEGDAPLRVEPTESVLTDESAVAWRARPVGSAAVADLPGGRQRWAQVYRLDPYLPGEHRVGFAPFQVTAGAGKPQTVTWEPVAVRVTAGVTGDAAEARPPTGIEELPPPPITAGSRWRAVLSAALLVVCLGIVVQLLRRAVRRPPPPMPPEKWAERELAALEQAPAEEFADRLSRVIRTYLERRAGLPATRRTTAELLAAAESAPVPGVIPVDQARPVLEWCDRVKFAGLTPAADDCRDRLAEARALVSQVSADVRP